MCCNATDFFILFYLCCWFLFLLWCDAVNSTNACMRDIAMCAFFVRLIRGSVRSVRKTDQAGSHIYDIPAQHCDHRIH